VLYEPGDLVVSCNPDDVAVDGVWVETVTATCHNPEAPFCIEAANHTYTTDNTTLGAYPMAGTAAPGGYTNYRNLTLRAAWEYVTNPQEGDPFLYSDESSIAVRVTCATTTP
jgi:hypothetical protein